jgi:hypothetical protein
LTPSITNLRHLPPRIMAARRIIKGSAADVENGNDVKDSYDSAVSYGSGSTFTGRWSSPLIALGLLTLVATAAYYERNVLVSLICSPST